MFSKFPVLFLQHPMSTWSIYLSFHEFGRKDKVLESEVLSTLKHHSNYA